jgi:hypothetical protein
MSIRVRDRGWRRRPGGSTLVRTRPRFGVRPPPVPYVDQIVRYLYPTLVADYESVATASWVEEDISDAPFSGAPSPETWNCYTCMRTVANQGTDSDYVILDPIRWSHNEPTTNGGYWDFADPLFNTGMYGSLLPVSGNSHVSDGKVPLVTFPATYLTNIPGWYDLTSRIPEDVDLTGATVSCLHRNRVVRPKYMRVRFNGTAVSPLIDFDVVNNELDWLINVGGWNGTSSPPSNGGYARPSVVPSVQDLRFLTDTSALQKLNYDFDFTAGDALEFDIWYEMGMRPRTGNSSANIAGYNHAVLTRYNTANNARNSALFLNYIARLYGRTFSDGFDPKLDTYTFEFVGGNWHPGDGASGVHKAITGDGWTASITSQRVFYSGTIASGTNAGRAAQITLSYDREIPIITMIVSGRGTRTYRPSASGDYVTYWHNRDTGLDWNNNTSGVFNHLGATTFSKFLGHIEYPPILSPDTHFPSGVQVVHASQ